MKILKTQVLRGPNIWSNYGNKLIQVRLDLEEMEQFPTDKIDGFADWLKEMFPNNKQFLLFCLLPYHHFHLQNQ